MIILFFSLVEWSITTENEAYHQEFIRQEHEKFYQEKFGKIDVMKDVKNKS